MSTQKDFVKITFEDIEVARKFFNNENHLADFMLNVCNFYMGKSVVTRYKVVSRYIATYEQVMSRVIEAKEFGKKGAKQKVENQKDTQHTLEGGAKAPTLPNTKLQLLNTKYKICTPPDFLEFENYCIEKGFSNIAKRVYEYYSTAQWKDSKGSQVKNWKQKLQGVWFKDENKDKSQTNSVIKMNF